MHFSNTLLHLYISCIFLAQAGLAKPISGFVTLINATPFDWELTSSHAYQLDWNFPSIVKAGTFYEQFIKFKKDHHDDGAEAYYTLVNSPSPVSFIVKARPPKHIEIQFQDTLSSLNNPENSVINLGFVENGAVSFVLSGNGDGPYISSNPPVAWMQSTLSSIGSKSLREISIPTSHDSGMNEVTISWGGRTHNTVTQTVNTFKQLVNGARIFDIRPLLWRGKLYTGHFSQFGSGMVGGTGRKISDIVSDINSFTAQYPGELILLDINHQMNADNKFRDFGLIVWTKLYEELNKIQALWFPSALNLPDDLSSVPLSTFIAPGSKSTVLIRLPNSAPLPEPSIRPGSLARRNVATYASYASADPTDGMTAQGPALQDDDNVNSTTTDDGINEPTPAVLPPNVSAGTDDDNTGDDGSNSQDNDNIADSSLAGMTLFSLPTGLPSLAPKSEPMPAEVPVQIGSSSMAFFHESHLPITGSYADTDKSQCLINDQLAKLGRDRPNAQAKVHKSTWTITQRWKHILDVENKKTSITADAVAAHRALFGNLWGAMSRITYPNMIEVDDIHNSQLTALCMAINDYFASPWILLRSKVWLVRSMNDTSATEHEANTRILEALESPEPRKINISESECNVIKSYSRTDNDARIP